MAGNARTTITATIFVYKGALGLDWSEKRNILLAFKSTDNSKPVVVHAAGWDKDFRVEAVDEYDPTRSRNVSGRAELGTLQVQTCKTQLVGYLSQTPANNTVND
jgi:hypothetical protein